MEYGLLPVEAALSFMGILLITYNKKQQFLTSKTVLYKYFLYFALSYGALLFGGIVLLKYFGKNFFSIFVWRAQGMCMFGTWIVFYIYCLATVYDLKEVKIFKIINSKLEFKIICSFLLIYLIALFIPTYISLFDNIDVNNIEIFTRDSSNTILLVLFVSSISLFSRIIPNRKKLSKEFIFSTVFGCVICMLICIFHMFYHANTFLPLAFVVFAYVLYFFVENPDILLLEETVKLQKLNDGDENKFDFFDNLTDEVNIPIDNILSICNDMKNNGFDNSYENMENILTYSNNLFSSLNNLFDSSLINKVDVTNKNYEVSELVNEITSVLKDKIGNKKLKLFLNFSPSISSKLRGDFDKICDIINTLVTNSCECTTYGKIMINLSTKKVNNMEQLTFKLVDTGEGISEEDQKNYYTNFDNSLPYLKKVKNLSDLLNGKFTFKSTERIGATYYVQFAQEIVDSTPIGQTFNKKVIESERSIDFTKYKVLLVDDDKLSLKLSEKIFKKFGFEVVLSSDGNNCINKIKAGEKYDLILVDIMMSDFSGVDVLKALRMLEDIKLPPIIAFTANALSGMKEEYLNEGFDDYLEKPIVYKDLTRIFNKYL